MGLLKELPELIEAGVISDDTAARIRDHYRKKHASANTSRSMAAFAIIGAVLLGLGIILIVAHNWDDFDRFTKSVFSFLPLVLGQAFCGYVLLRKSGSTAFRESSAAFLVFATGATISLVSQVYHIMGDLSGFMLTWSLLALPVVYILRSSMSALLYLIGITVYACDIGYWTYPNTPPYLYLLLFAGVIPFYVLRLRKYSHSNFNGFLHWFIALSFAICLGAFSGKKEELMFISYMSLFGLYYLISRILLREYLPRLLNGHYIIGIAGTVGLLLILSFRKVWEEIYQDFFTGVYFLRSQEIVFAILITLAALYLAMKVRKKGLAGFNHPFAYIFILFVLIYSIGLGMPVIAFALVNLVLLFTGIIIIREGAASNHLGVLNFGMLLIAALVTCRFFDSNLPFYIRGILFMLVGAGFIVANVMTLKNRRKNEA